MKNICPHQGNCYDKTCYHYNLHIEVDECKYRCKYINEKCRSNLKIGDDIE